MRFERILFYYAEWQDTYRQLQYDACIKEKEERGERKGKKCRIASKYSKEEEEEEYNRISRGITTSGRLFVRDYSYPLSPKLVIIDDFIEKIVVERSDRRFIYQKQSS